MTRRSRIICYGASAALLLVGSAGAALVPGVTGEVLAMALIGSGLVILTGLVFMEVGLSEDRDRDKERLRRAPQSPPHPSPPRSRRLEPHHRPRQRGARHER